MLPKCHISGEKQNDLSTFRQAPMKKNNLQVILVCPGRFREGPGMGVLVQQLGLAEMKRVTK